MRPATPEDVLAFSWLGEVTITPDGELVAFTRRDGYKEFGASSSSQIWVAPTNGDPARPFTGGTHTDSMPRWSPDGQTLAFLSNREGDPAQVFLLPREGGAARRLTNVKNTIHHVAWSPDGGRIAFLMAEPEPAALAERRKQGDDVMLYEQNHPWWRLWTVDVAGGGMRQITTGSVQVWEFGWAPNGGFALLTGAEPYEWSWFKPTIAYVGPEGGVPRTVYTTPEKCFAMPRVSPDGTRIAFLAGIWSDRGINAGELLTVAIDQRKNPSSPVQAANASAQRTTDNGQMSSLSPNYNGSIWWYQFSADGAQVDFLAYEQGEAAVGRIAVESGERTTVWRGEVAFDEDHEARYFANNGMIALVRSDATTPQEVWVARSADGGRQSVDGREFHHRPPSTVHRLKWQQLTAINMPIAAELALGEQRTVLWNSSDGQAMQGILILPVGYTPGQRVPLVTWVHGGPAWLYTHTYYLASRGFQVLAGAGFAVFAPNPRGSNGWGIAFLEQNIGDFGGKDYEDIISGIDALVAEGIADGERLGIGGWSYGGFMSAWAITQTQRFKAAVVGAAITNWRSFHGTSEVSLWDRVSLRANPYQRGGLFETRSPITYVESVTTPALIQHGADDRVVPPDQGYEWFRALKDCGVPVEMAIYPREGHLFSERLHLLDRMRRWLAWFRRYLR